MQTMRNFCPACTGQKIQSFYRVDRVPVHSVINIATREEALSFPRRDLELAFCSECGFVFNQLFDIDVMDYCSRYEETQGWSPTFSGWHRELAHSVVDRFRLHNQSIIEIGCGKGEFLTLLCEIAEARGVGFDPAYVPERNQSPLKNQIQFIRDFYSEKYSSHQADFVCCKMTLEHIHKPLAFLQTVRRSIGDHLTTVFFQVPDMCRVITECAFWDVYYEHCSYFTMGSLARIFRRARFEVSGLESVYDAQYITIDAVPTSSTTGPRLAEEDD